MTNRWLVRSSIVIAAAAIGFAANAQTTRYDIEFCVVGSPGNRPPDESEIEQSPVSWRAGTVNYRYAIAKTELTTNQLLEFVRAYATFNAVNVADAGLTGYNILGRQTASGPKFELLFPAAANRPTNMSWRTAARYCNWLTNGKAMRADAFEHGAYDTSTFGREPSGEYTDQLTRTAGADFWIPNLDEWVKATYFDPNRYAIGHEGYWAYSGRSVRPLRYGWPQEGGQTNAGTPIPGVPSSPIDVGSFPLVMSPWGLLDTCGGITEWLEGTLYPDRPNTGVLNAGAQAGNIDEMVVEYDRLGTVFSNTPPNSSWPGGLRIAMRIDVECAADLNGDQVVDDADFAAFVVAYDALACGEPATGCAGDFNMDGAVDDSDFVVFVAGYERLICG